MSSEQNKYSAHCSFSPICKVDKTTLYNIKPNIDKKNLKKFFLQDDLDLFLDYQLFADRDTWKLRGEIFAQL